MGSSDHHRFPPPSSADSPVKDANFNANCLDGGDDDEEEYEEIEVEEEIVAEEEIEEEDPEEEEEEEEDPEEDPEEEEEEEMKQADDRGGEEENSAEEEEKEAAAEEEKPEAVEERGEQEENKVEAEIKDKELSDREEEVEVEVEEELEGDAEDKCNKEKLFLCDPNLSITDPEKDVDKDMISEGHDDNSQFEFSKFWKPGRLSRNGERRKKRKRFSALSKSRAYLGTDDVEGTSNHHKSSPEFDRRTWVAQEASLVDDENQIVSEDTIKSDDFKVHGCDEDNLHVQPVPTEEKICIDIHREDSSVGTHAEFDTFVNVKGSEVPCLHMEVASSSPLRDDSCKEANTHSNFMEKEVQSVWHTKEDAKWLASRCSTSLTRLRSLSPEAELNIRDKRPSILCSFFVKGWCIKGGSCRFLHKRDHDSNCELGWNDAPRKGSRETVEGLKSSPFPSDGTGHRHLAEDGGGLVGGNYSSDENNSTNLQENLLPSDDSFCKYESSRGFELSSNSHSSNSLSYQRSMDEKSVRFGHHMRSGHHSQSLSSPMDHYNLSDWTRHSSGYPSLREHLQSCSNDFNRRREDVALRSPLMRSPPPLFVLRSERSTLATTSNKQQFSCGYKSKFTPYNWVPSVPFQPSFSMASLGISSTGYEYDPFHDSIERTKDNPFSGQGLTYQGMPHSLSAEKDPGGWHKFSEIVWPEHNLGRGKDISTVEAEAKDIQMKTVVPTNNNYFHAATEDVRKAGQTGFDNDFKNLSDRVKHKDEMKVDRTFLINAIDVDPMEYEDLNKESKAMKQFRAALVEFIKEQMKPIWHEGHLTRDAYKLIVQKAEEKIATSLQPNQIPCTAEQIKHYLSFSHSKISKLIQGYAERYRKT